MQWYFKFTPTSWVLGNTKYFFYTPWDIVRGITVTKTLSAIYAQK